MRQAGMHANIAIRTWQRDQIRKRRVELFTRTLADKARIGKRHKVVQGRGNQGLLNGDLNMLRGMRCVPVPYGLQGANGGV